MSKYDELVKALRYCVNARNCEKCAYRINNNSVKCRIKRVEDAATAIEALEDTVQAQDKALKECAKQLAEMQEDLDYANAANTELYGAFQENEKLKAEVELMKPFMPDFFPDANKAVLPKMEVQDGTD